MMAIQKLEALADEAIQSKMAAGLAVGVVRDGEVVYTKGFGVRDANTGEPVTEHTLFHTASISKTFVATALVQLMERGKVDLDHPVVRYLPYFRLNDPRCEQITVRQMLTHTSGMPDTGDYAWDRPQYDDDELENYVRSLAPLKLDANPGERHAYSNIAYEV